MREYKVTSMTVKETILNSQSEYSQIYQQLAKVSSFDQLSFDRLVEDTEPEVALKILARFWMTLQESLAQVENGLKQDNGDMIWKACHKVAGSAELVGFKNFGQQSRSLDAAVKAMNSPESHLSEIQKYLEQGHVISKDISAAFPQLKHYL